MATDLLFGPGESIVNSFVLLHRASNLNTTATIASRSKICDKKQQAVKNNPT